MNKRARKRINQSHGFIGEVLLTALNAFNNALFVKKVLIKVENEKYHRHANFMKNQFGDDSKERNEFLDRIDRATARFLGLTNFHHFDLEVDFVNDSVAWNFKNWGFRVVPQKLRQYIDIVTSWDESCVGTFRDRETWFRDVVGTPKQVLGKRIKVIGDHIAGVKVVPKDSGVKVWVPPEEER